MRIKRNITARISYIKTRNKKFDKFLQRNEINDKDFNNFSVIDSKNILLKNFIHLLRLEELNEEIQMDHINFVKICSRYLFATTIKQDNEELIQNLEATIWKLVLENNYAYFVENLEEKVLNENEFEFSKIEVKKYFNFHKIYALIGNVFAAPFSVKERKSYYEYGYYLAMYLNLHNFINKNSVHDNVDMFLIKILVNKKTIQAISDLSPDFFNLFVIKNNKWINHINKRKLIKEAQEYEEKN
ncbi:hypothetical protein CXP39_00490 [Mesoplasma syrphidae]|uniref:Uncharacterized protein n=1 Tax=Mesoplasma syrphidae TaxID=225999 RepID=A0A2K9BY48_9MOLU|nr:hypothetical protein [Mesoplasma syrphidae]AUF83288.1 hypothetical protein CXP39_00490 [Mesoplasma syrphidae]